MEGKGIQLTCHACGKRWTMDEFGQMVAENGITEYPHIPDWYRWQRDCVRKELEDCMSSAPCPQCGGDRLSDIARAVTVGGIGIMDFCRMSIQQELEFMEMVLQK